MILMKDNHQWKKHGCPHKHFEKKVSDHIVYRRILYNTILWLTSGITVLPAVIIEASLINF